MKKKLEALRVQAHLSSHTQWAHRNLQSQSIRWSAGCHEDAWWGSYQHWPYMIGKQNGWRYYNMSFMENFFLQFAKRWVKGEHLGCGVITYADITPSLVLQLMYCIFHLISQIWWWLKLLQHFTMLTHK